MAKKNSTKSSAKYSQSEALNNVIDYILNNALFPYQREFVVDNSRFKIASKARQIGLSTCLGLEGLLDALRGESVYYVSRTEKQSIYLLDKFFKWVEFFRQAGIEIEFTSKTKTECRLGTSDIKSLTSSAVAGEGFSGNVYLDEFALHDNDREIYRSLYPTITWGYKIRIISRPFGQSNLFYDIFTDINRFPDFSRYQYDIYRAIGDGLPISIDEIKRNLDEDAFAENYECKFIDESTSFFPYELIRPCISEEYAGEGTNRQVYCGIDLGRKNDATVIYILVKLNEIFYTKKIEELKNYTFDAQIETIERVFKEEGVTHCCIDATGFGMQMAETLKKRYGFIQPLNFSVGLKEELVLTLKRKFENKEVRIPDRQQLIYDIHSIKRVVTAGNQITFDSRRSSLGHSDSFWAFAMAVRSAEEYNMPRIILLDEIDEEQQIWQTL